MPSALLALAVFGACAPAMQPAPVPLPPPAAQRPPAAVQPAADAMAPVLAGGRPAAEADAAADARTGALADGRTTHLLPVHHDAASGRVLLTIPRPGVEMLYLNTLATGLGTTAAGLDRGQLGASALVRFERRGPRVLMIQQNTAHRAFTADSAVQRTVRESFPVSVMASFAVQSDGPAGTVVDATDFFLSDSYGVAARLRAANMGNLRIDASRSYIDGARTGSFPDNTEVRAVLSYVSEEGGGALGRLAPDARWVTFEQQHSFVRLPDPPMAIRAFDPRAGIFPFSFFDFAQPFDGDYRQRGIARWRLEPRDTAAYLRGELTEPVRPIIYYMDPGIPEPYRSAFFEGGRWWNSMFEAAGWRNAFRIEPLPAGVDPLDARYPVIYWVHRQERGPSVGPSFRDPRTGEIVGTVIRMDSYRSLVNHDIYMGLVPAASASGLQLDAEAFAMARRRQHMAHEIGHTLGLAHNFIAAAQGRSSVMDYPYPLIRLDARGRLDIGEAYRPSGGAHDTLAIRYAYTWFPDARAERVGLQRIVREAEAHGLRFVADAHAGGTGSIPVATQWVEGDDMLSALERTTAVRRVLIEHFDQRAARPGEPLAVLNRRFAHVYLHHRYAVAGATKYIGGMDFGYALAGEATIPTRVLPAARQRRAVHAIVQLLRPAELRVPDRIVSLIPPVPFGYDADLTLIPSPAGTAFDPVTLAHSFVQEVVDAMLHPQRANRLAVQSARDPEQLTVHEVLAALVAATWSTPEPARVPHATDAALRRVAQRAVLDGMLDLAGSRSATPEVRSAAEHYLQQLLRSVSTAAGGSIEERSHRATARRDIERYFRGEDQPAARPRPPLVPLPWP
jgi:hypothetical protein